MADKSATPVDRTVTGMVAGEKCSWVLKVTKDAPTFKIKTLTGNFKDNYYLHYIEYDSANGVLWTNGAAPTPWLSAEDKTEANTVKQTFYNPDTGVLDQDYANIYSVINPADATTNKRKRWFPAAIVTDQVAAYVARRTTYLAAKDTYDGLRTTYNTELLKAFKKSNWLFELFETKTKVTVPTKPVPPT